MLGEYIRGGAFVDGESAVRVVWKMEVIEINYWKKEIKSKLELQLKWKSRVPAGQFLLGEKIKTLWLTSRFAASVTGHRLVALGGDRTTAFLQRHLRLLADRARTFLSWYEKERIITELFQIHNSSNASSAYSAPAHLRAVVTLGRAVGFGCGRGALGLRTAETKTQRIPHYTVPVGGTEKMHQKHLKKRCDTFKWIFFCKSHQIEYTSKVFWAKLLTFRNVTSTFETSYHRVYGWKPSTTVLLLPVKQ